MKKAFALLALVLVFAIALVSCGNGTTETTTNEETTVSTTTQNQEIAAPGDDYVKITTSSRDFASQTASSLSEQETKMLIDAHNDMNKRVARRNGEEAPEKIQINPNNKEEVEELLTPDIYTYDDLPK